MLATAGSGPATPVRLTAWRPSGGKRNHQATLRQSRVVGRTLSLSPAGLAGLARSGATRMPAAP